VLAEQIVTFRGLEVQRRRVAYGNIDAKEATEIFIRSALVEENLVPTERSSQGEDDDPQSHPRHKRARTPKRQSALTVREDDSLPAQYPFLSHNRSTRQKVETWQTRVRSSQLIDPEQALCEFYRQRIENVSSLHELNRLLQAQTDPDFLRVTELELTGGQTLSFDAEAFPDSIILDGQPVTVTYAYAPGEDHDGATLRISHSFAQSVESAVVDWAVPGLRSEQIAELLRALPKSLRRQLMPFPPKVAEITRDFQPVGPASFAEQLARFIRQRYDIEVPPATWPANTLPQHLRLRIEILGDNGKVVCAGRDLKKLREQLEKVSVAPTKTPPIWQQAARAWEKFGLDAWTFGDLPERITVGQHLDLPLYAWPGLEVEQGLVNVRLFRTRETARQASLGGGQRLVELALRRELAWIEKDLRALIRFEQLYAPIGSIDELRETALENVKRHILPVEGLPGLTTVIFQEAVEMARRKIPGLATQLIDRMGSILELRMQLQQRFGQSPTVRAQAKRTLTDFSQLGATQTPPPATNPLSEELAELLPARFLETIPFEQLVHLPRYLKALLIRSERAALNPAKDQERVRLIAPYKEALRQMQAGRNPTRERQKATEEFRWMIEEFKVSLFAQELRTAFPISARRLDEKVESMERGT
jgi:ATP-dependent helicase HrpA